MEKGNAALIVHQLLGLKLRTKMKSGVLVMTQPLQSDRLRCKLSFRHYCFNKIKMLVKSSEKFE